ncbi:MAG: hypothetical protein A3F54_02850 [Candidatus Kerfeldbacteria bacterium RIFCSPHIGHO2_12_FULL_48_17]|uniref:Aminoglycoside phosphotransferase domain-containing protein n=1 Tax=Candidatus Kerfeldbacteria bacterium RIFCSPHIGHO2_12_FULL_48_17 TaxID=1798542 RepID=A0A1G2B2S1_9BACT|nr:MAG: hypothetical protein A3F54_02850 [Candidatus Kerfeldbacteria bacterium RIFCSPHIGHO2_12_FULL_48_17]
MKPEQEKNIPKPEIEKPVETPQQVESAAQEAIQSLEERAQSIQVLAREKVANSDDEAIIRPLDEQIEKATDESARNIEQAAAEVLRERWIEQAQEAIKKHGYTIDLETEPYKSFQAEKFERFYIQKCFDAQGRPVVVKVGAPNSNADKHIQRESKLYDLLGDRTQAAKSAGQELRVRFPEKLDFFEEDEQQALVVTYESNDDEAKQKLSPEKKIDIITTIIEDMRKLSVPPEEVAKPYYERSMPIMKAYEYKAQMGEALDILREKNILSHDSVQRLHEKIGDSEKLIDSFPLFFDHGDIHGENIFYTPASETQPENITLIDVESIRLTNEFAPLAQAVNREALMTHYKQNTEAINDENKLIPLLKKQFEFTDHDGKLTEKVEEKFINSHERDEDAKKVYAVMRIHEILQTMKALAEKENSFTKRIINIHKDMLEEQMTVLGL